MWKSHHFQIILLKVMSWQAWLVPHAISARSGRHGWHGLGFAWRRQGDFHSSFPVKWLPEAKPF
jgi:hypothetical protein